jgi:hypothetical protein
MKRTELVFDALELAENLTQQLLLGLMLAPGHYNRPAARRALASVASWGPSLGNKMPGVRVGSSESARSGGVTGEESWGLGLTLNQLMVADASWLGVVLQGCPR